MTGVAALEFWLPVIIRSFEGLLMARLGVGFYTELEDNMPIARVRKMMFGIFVAVPLLESILPLDWSNPTMEQQRNSHNFEKRFKFPIYIWTVLEVLTTIKVLSFLADPKSPFDFKNKMALTIVLGIFSGLGINFSHELIHKSSMFEKVLGYTLLTNVK